MKKYLSKGVSILFFASVVTILFFTSRWVDKNLYIRSVVYENPLYDNMNSDPEEFSNETETISELPTEIEQFKIISADKILKYLTTKYDEDFVILDYDIGGILDRETVLAYPANGDDYKDVFQVSRRKDVSYEAYTDNYLCVYAKDRIADKLVEGLDLDNDYHIEVKVNSLTIAARSLIDISDLNQMGINANIEIYVDSKDFENSDLKDSEDKLAELADQCAEYMESQGIKGQVEIVSMNLKDINCLNTYTIATYDTPLYVNRKIVRSLNG